MKKLLLILTIISTTALKTVAQERVFYDPLTISAITAAFAEEQMTERIANEALDSILARTTSTTAYAAAIFAYKYANRKARTSTWPLSTDENYYYIRTKELAKRIMNKIILDLPREMYYDREIYLSTSDMFLTITYFMKVCDEVYQLCQLFETIVTNGDLGFKDVGFYTIKKNIRDMITKYGAEVSAMKNKLSAIAGYAKNFSQDNLRQIVREFLNDYIGKLSGPLNPSTLITDNDGNVHSETIDNYASMLEDANQSLGNIKNILMGGNFSLVNIKNLVDNLKTAYDDLHSLALVQELIKKGVRFIDYAGECIPDYRDLFESLTFVIDDVLTDYYLEQDDPAEHYRQEYYIIDTFTQKQVLINYNPDDYYGFGNPPDINHWYNSMLNPDTGGYPLTVRDSEYAFDNSERAAGCKSHKDEGDITKKGCAEKNKTSASTGIYYEFWSQEKIKYKPDNAHSNNYTHAYIANSIRVTKITTTITEHSKYVYDSKDKKISKEDFLKQLQELCDQLSISGKDKRHVFTVEEGAKTPYLDGDEPKIQYGGFCTVYAECEDNNKLAEGSRTYKHADHPRSDKVDDHTRSVKCSLATDVEPYDVTADIAEIEEEIEHNYEERKKLADKLAELKKQLRELERKLYDQNTSQEDRNKIRKSIENKEKEISNYEKSIEAIDDELDQMELAKKEIAEDADDGDDHHYRIPHILRDLTKTYNIVWEDEGYYATYNTFIRKGRIGDITRTENGEFRNNIITFKCVVSVKAPVYILWFRIHRAQITLKWELLGNFKDKFVTESFELPRATKEMSDEEKKAIKEGNTNKINAALARAAQDYPKCKISYELREVNEVQDDTKPTIHLLYASDRLAIAREIHKRMVKIYADIVEYEKLINTKQRQKSVYDLLSLFDAEAFRDLAYTRRRAAIVNSKKAWDTKAKEANNTTLSRSQYLNTVWPKFAVETPQTDEQQSEQTSNE